MAVPRLRVPSGSPGGSLRQAAGLSSDEVELYHRTYTTLLRSSGETLLRVLEPSHAAMSSSLHSLAHDMERPDLGAFLYSVRRLPASIYKASVIVVGQESEAFAKAGLGRIEDWEAAEAPARRRRWYDSGRGTLAVLLASTSDLDDAIPTLVAYQLEWNKLHALLRAAELPDDPEPLDVAEACGGSEEDWTRMRESWPDGLAGFINEVRDRKLNLRLRMLGGSQSGYARLTRRWWAPVRATLTDQGLSDRPMYFVLVEHPLAREPRERDGGRERGRDRRLRRVAGPGLHDRRARALPLVADRGLVGELPLLRRAPLLRGAARRRAGVGAPPPPRARDRHHAPLLADRPARVGAGDRAGQARPGRAGLAARPDRRRAAGEHARRDRQHRVSARARRLQHPARDHDRARHAARRLRARQGGDAERRRRRRPDLRRHPRRALGLDVLAGQRVLVRRHRARTWCSAPGWTTSAR